ncbi:hypothetical protein CC1G_10850 [Coprinopsis cinerea okayama7|uniref:Uncharacterized protein n=1 Tax=Coprinopsis cinerea (strain Okayama-7 / 130 / ATCC MYA-4618 / FGSC 9003) TaxID=240176 RepID=A8NKS2_COPC7|nr:hypothetical protein CC1G_10850 [Coprinopsis cinerea okayama7\|eukprot:XP_001834532.1 hypothetical protein CC1G_10850 [Coprinopsis cinerea okayama7\
MSTTDETGSATTLTSPSVDEPSLPLPSSSSETTSDISTPPLSPPVTPSVPPPSSPPVSPSQPPPTTPPGGGDDDDDDGPPPPSSSDPGSSVPPSSTPSSESTEPTSESTTESVTESTATESLTSVFESASVITSDGVEVTTLIQVTTTIEPGGVITSPANKDDDKGTPTGAIVGGIAGLIVIGAFLFFLLRRKRNKFDKEFDGNFDPDYVTAAAASGAKKPGSAHKRKSGSMDANMRQRVNLDDPASGNGNGGGLEAALAEDDGMGGRLAASTVGGGIVTPFPYPQQQPQQQPYPPTFPQPQQPYGQYNNNNGAASVPVGGVYGQSPYSPPMPTVSPPPSGSVNGHSAHGHGVNYYDYANQGAYGGIQDPRQQGYGGVVSPVSTGEGNPYLGGHSASSHAGSHYPSPSLSYSNPQNAATAAAVAAAAANTRIPPSNTTATTTSTSSDGGRKTMSAKEREALGQRGPYVVNVTDEDGERGSGSARPVAQREATGGSVGSGPLPSPYDTQSDGNGSGGNDVPPVPPVVQHKDGGRVEPPRVQEEEEEPPAEIPPAYDSIQYEGDTSRR